MKRIFYSLVFATLAGGMTACGGGAKNNNAAQEENSGYNSNDFLFKITESSRNRQFVFTC